MCFMSAHTELLLLERKVLAHLPQFSRLARSREPNEMDKTTEDLENCVFVLRGNRAKKLLIGSHLRLCLVDVEVI